MNRETIKYAIVQQRIDNILKYSTTLTYANKYMRSKKLAKYGYPKISLLCCSQIDKLAGSILERSVNQQTSNGFWPRVEYDGDAMNVGKNRKTSNAVMDSSYCFMKLRRLLH